MAGLSKVLGFDRTKVDVGRALLLLAVLVALLAVAVALGARQYALSALFGALFAALADAGGAFAPRVKRLGLFALIGAVGTALAFAVGDTFSHDSQTTADAGEDRWREGLGTRIAFPTAVMAMVRSPDIDVGGRSSRLHPVTWAEGEPMVRPTF